MADLALMSSLEITGMAPSLNFAMRLSSLPHEVRDIVYGHVFSNRKYTVGFGRRYYVVSPGDRAFDTFLILAHEKALNSRLARELCQAFWSVKFSQHTMDINWKQLSDLFNPGLVTIMETTDRESERTSYGAQPTTRFPLITTIRPRDFVSDIEVNINDNKELDLSNKNDLQKLSQRLAAVLNLPRLHRMEINLWVPRDCDCYWEVMPLIEGISTTCQELRRRIGNNLSVWIMRDWPHHRSTFKFMDHDVSWMWEAPGQEVRMIRGVRPSTAAEDRVRALMFVGVPPNKSQKSLLKELRGAASSIPQRREDIAAEEGGWKEKE